MLSPLERYGDRSPDCECVSSSDEGRGDVYMAASAVLNRDLRTDSWAWCIMWLRAVFEVRCHILYCSVS